MQLKLGDRRKIVFCDTDVGTRRMMMLREKGK